MVSEYNLINRAKFTLATVPALMERSDVLEPEMLHGERGQLDVVCILNMHPDLLRDHITIAAGTDEGRLFPRVLYHIVLVSTHPELLVALVAVK